MVCFVRNPLRSRFSISNFRLNEEIDTLLQPLILAQFSICYRIIATVLFLSGSIVQRSHWHSLFFSFLCPRSNNLFNNQFSLNFFSTHLIYKNKIGSF